MISKTTFFFLLILFSIAAGCYYIGDNADNIIKNAHGQAADPTIERFADYEVTTHANGTTTYVLGLDLYMLHNDNYIPFLVTHNDTYTILETATDTIALHRDTCTYSHYSKSDVMVIQDRMTWLDADTGLDLIPDGTCYSYRTPGAGLIAAVKYDDNGSGTHSYQYVNGKFKVTMAYERTAGPPIKIGYLQSITHEADTTIYRNETHTWAESYNRTAIESHEPYAIHSSRTYDFDLAFDFLESINIESTNTVYLFTFNTPTISAGEQHEIDPTWSTTTTSIKTREARGTGTSCNAGTYNTLSAATNHYMLRYATTDASGCRATEFYLNIPSAAHAITSGSISWTGTNPFGSTLKNESCSLYISDTAHAYNTIKTGSDALIGTTSSCRGSNTISLSDATITFLNDNDPSNIYVYAISTTDTRNTVFYLTQLSSFSFSMTGGFVAPGAPSISESVTASSATFERTAGTAGTQTVTHYSLRCSDTGSLYSGTQTVVSGATLVSSYTITPAAQGNAITCEWRDETTNTMSAWSTEITATIPTITPPGQPTLTTQVLSQTIYFDHIFGTEGDEDVTHYSFRCTGNDLTGTVTFIDSAEQLTTYYAFTNLDGGDWRSCQWRDETENTMSEWSDAVRADIPYTPPGRPSIAAQNITTDSITFLRTPGTAGDETVTRYYLTCTGDVTRTTQGLIPANNEITQDGLIFNTQYICKLRDDTTNTMSAFSNPITTYTLDRLPPGAPTLNNCVEFAANENYCTSTAGAAGYWPVTHFDLSCNSILIADNVAIGSRNHTFAGDYSLCTWTDIYDTDKTVSSAPLQVTPYSIAITDTTARPGQPALSAQYLQSLATILFTRTAGTPSDETVTHYDLRCFGTYYDDAQYQTGWKDQVSNAAIPANNQYSFTGAEHDDTLTCQWRDRTTNLESFWSNGAFIEIDNEKPPPAPSIRTEPAGESILFTYTAGTGTLDSAVTGYKIYCNTADQFGYTLEITSASPPSSSYIWTGSEAPNIYRCYWQDVNIYGDSRQSNVETITLFVDGQAPPAPVESAPGASLEIAMKSVRPTGDPVRALEGLFGETVYFVIPLFPFVVILFSSMAGPKTVSIYAFITLAIMGILHGSGYYVFENWYWTLMFLFAIPLILGYRRNN